MGSVIPAGEVSKVATPTARLAPPALLLLPLRPRGRAPRPGAGRLTVVLTASRTSGPNPLPPDPEFSRSLNSPSQPPPPRAWGAEPPGWWEERPTAGRGCARRRARRPARERPLHPLPRPRHQWKGRNSGTCPGELSWSFEPPPLGNRADASVARLLCAACWVPEPRQWWGDGSTAPRAGDSVVGVGLGERWTDGRGSRV